MRLSLMIWSVSVPSSSLWKGNVFTIFAVGDCWKSVCRLVMKATKPNAQNPQGGIVEKEAPIHISNLMLIDPKSGKPTKVGRKTDAKGKLVRFAKKSGEEIK